MKKDEKSIREEGKNKFALNMNLSPLKGWTIEVILKGTTRQSFNNTTGVVSALLDRF